ncbi:MAG: hypothetical protein MMC23_006802 [Stictis urceolatum]|nr:hypothetical protein [Stictis urceolata]
MTTNNSTGNNNSTETSNSTGNSHSSSHPYRLGRKVCLAQAFHALSKGPEDLKNLEKGFTQWIASPNIPTPQRFISENPYLDTRDRSDNPQVLVLDHGNNRFLVLLRVLHLESDLEMLKIRLDKLESSAHPLEDKSEEERVLLASEEVDFVNTCLDLQANIVAFGAIVPELRGSLHPLHDELQIMSDRSMTFFVDVNRFDDESSASISSVDEAFHEAMFKMERDVAALDRLIALSQKDRLALCQKKHDEYK